MSLVTSTKLKAVLVATDLTATSVVAIKVAAEIARATGALLIGAHVLELPASLRRWSAASFPTDLGVYRQLLKNQTDAAKLAVDKQLQTHAGGYDRVRCVARPGSPAEVLEELADELKADLIVLARGRGGRLGQTCERVVRKAGRAVLVAPVRLPSAARASKGGPRPKLRATHRRLSAAEARGKVGD